MLLFVVAMLLSKLLLGISVGVLLVVISCITIIIIIIISSSSIVVVVAFVWVESSYAEAPLSRLPRHLLGSVNQGEIFHAR